MPLDFERTTHFNYFHWECFMKFECAPIAIRSPVMSYAPPSPSHPLFCCPFLSFSLLSLSDNFFRCSKRKCNKRRRQLAMAKMNVIHSFSHSFIHSLSLAFVVVASLCILRMQLSLESGSIVRSCTASPRLLSPSIYLLSLALPLRTGQVNYNLHCLSPRSSVCFISLSLSSPPN